MYLLLIKNLNCKTIKKRGILQEKMEHDNVTDFDAIRYLM